MDSNSKIHDGVKLGINTTVGDFCVVGLPVKNAEETTIGDEGIIRSHTVIYGGNKIGENFQTGHGVIIRENNTIGNNVSIGSRSNIEHHVIIEDDVRIHSGCFIPEFSVLKKGCWIGPCVCLTNAPYPRSAHVKEELKGVVIGENAKIGANTTILPGVNIGKNVLIGAGSVVTKDIPDNAVAFGCPAVIVKNVQDLKYDDGTKVYPDLA